MYTDDVDVRRSNAVSTILAHIRRVNVEPLILLMAVSAGIYLSVLAPFVYYKACVQAFADVEPNIHYFCKVEIKDGAHEEAQALVQTETTHLALILGLAGTLPAIVFSFAAGSWSDHNGRKPLVVIALGGLMLSSVFIAFTAWKVFSSPYILIPASFISGVTGGELVAFMMIFASARDTCTVENLTIKISLYTAIASVGIFAGSLLTAYVIDRHGFLVVFLICQLFVLASFLYAVFVFRETKIVSQIVVDDAERADNFREERSIRSSCRKCCDEIGINKTISTLVRPRGDNIRKHLILGMVALTITILADSGAGSINFFFLKLPPIALADSTFGYLHAFNVCLQSIGTPLIIYVFKRRFRVHDTIIIFVAILCHSLHWMLIAFCETTWEVFAVSSLNFVSHIFLPGYRSFLASMVFEEETGSVFSLIASSEHVAPLLSKLLYNVIYPLSLSFFSGFVFLVSSALLLIPAAIILYIRLDIRQSERSAFSRREADIPIFDNDALEQT